MSSMYNPNKNVGLHIRRFNETSNFESSAANQKKSLLTDQISQPTCEKTKDNNLRLRFSSNFCRQYFVENSKKPLPQIKQDKNRSQGTAYKSLEN